MWWLLAVFYDFLFAADIYQRARRDDSWRWSLFAVTIAGVVVTFFASASPLLFLSPRFIDRHTGPVFISMFCVMLLCVGGITLTVNRMRRSQSPTPSLEER
jgi:uncharacterized membrane protein YhaH (DUF805 family)